jgi:tRNA(Ile)-lysidine synthase TilS/MesJ
MGGRKLLDSTFFVSKRIGRAAAGHAMFPHGSTALVALSGGLASATMLTAIVRRQARVPTRLTLVPVHVPDGLHGPRNQVEPLLAAHCAALSLPLHVLPASPAEGHFLPVPHAPLLLAAADAHQASVVILGHTLLDRALLTLLAMTLEGRLACLSEAEEAISPAGRQVRIVRPMSDLTPDAVESMAADEGIAALPLLASRPHPEVRAILLEFLEAKRGGLMEKLRNVVAAPLHADREYML